MDLLLDIHVFMWFMNGSSELSETIRKMIAKIENKCYFSIASLWEIGIKHSIGKLQLESGFDKIKDFIIENEIEILPLNFEHVQELVALPFHHRDPFDRIIIAQGIVDRLTLISKDNHFKKYPVATFWK